MRMLIIILLLTIFPIRENWSQTKYEIPCKEYLLCLSRDSLIAQIGVKEKTGNNDGYKVEQYLKSVGLKKGNPYCAAGQYWCFAVNAINANDIPIPKSGLAISPFNYAKKHGKKVDYIPAIDDLLIWNIARTIKGHIERITKVVNAKFVWTGGFNTSNGLKGSQADGNGVFPRVRDLFNPIARLLVKGLVGFKPIRATAVKQGCNVK